MSVWADAVAVVSIARRRRGHRRARGQGRRGIDPAAALARDVRRVWPGDREPERGGRPHAPARRAQGPVL